MYKQYKDSPYIIYDDGRCYSKLSNKFLSPKMSVKYPTYHIKLEQGKSKNVMIHRMVAETFLPNPENKPYVNHIDGDTHNFHLDNLEWVTARENSQHAHNSNLISKGDQTMNKYVGNLDGENWKEIYDYPNYLISSFGRVMNKRTKRLLKSYADNAGGYLCVNLWKNNKGTTFRVHKLVYMNFTNDFDLEGKVINHIDGDKTNNNINNLEKVSYTTNNLHAIYQIKTNKCNKPVIQLDKDKNFIAEYKSISEAQKSLGISNISRAIKKQGKAGNYYWQFK